MSNPFVSVIVPVYNDPEHLKLCLEALNNQTYPKNLYEVIVVDNGSDEPIDTLVSQFSQATAAFESRVGSYAARNKGTSLAKGEIIAFTDADCIPMPNWIEKGVEYLLQVPKCGLVVGKVELFFKDPANPTAVELFESMWFWRSQKDAIEYFNYGATANVFTFKSTIDDVGGFNTKFKSCGDQDWGQRIFSSGYKQVYADDACVYHPLRTSLAQLSKRVIRLQGGELDIIREKTGYSWKRFLKDLANDLKPPFRFCFYIWREEKLKGTLQKIKHIILYTYVKYLRAGERIRLQLRGSSRRS